MNRVYLAAAFSRKDEIRAVADDLKAAGVNVQSRWLYEPDPPTGINRRRFMRERAEIDVQDVLACDILVRFTDQVPDDTVPSYLISGSRMWEAGMAYQAGKTVIVVGGFQCVFDYLSSILHVHNVAELKEYLVLLTR